MLTDPSPEVVERVRCGMHAGWETFDAKLEGARFQLLHETISATVLDRRLAIRLVDELAELAQSYGYGCADGFLVRAGGYSEEEITEDPYLSALRNAVMEDPEETDYFVEIRGSERILHSVVGSPEAVAFLRGEAGWTIGQRMMEGYRQGVVMRSAQQVQATGTPSL